MRPSKTYLYILIVGSLFIVGTPALAVPVALNDLSGNISSCAGGGLIATEQWSSCGATLNWDVHQNPNGTWTYNYVLSYEQKDPSHIIIGVSSSFTEENILIATGAWELGLFGDAQGNSNPGIPGDLFGIKFEDPLGIFTVVSDRAPMWVDAYGKSGNSGGPGGGNPVYFHTDDWGGTGPYGKVVGPDTVSSTTVPESGTAALLGIGCFLLYLAQRAKKLGFGGTSNNAR